MSDDYKADARVSRKDKMSKMGCFDNGGSVGEAETFTAERDRLGDDAMTKLPPRAGSGFTEERNALGNRALSSLPPRKFKAKD